MSFNISLPISPPFFLLHANFIFSILPQVAILPVNLYSFRFPRVLWGSNLYEFWPFSFPLSSSRSLFFSSLSHRHARTHIHFTHFLSCLPISPPPSLSQRCFSMEEHKVPIHERVSPGSAPLRARDLEL